LRKSLVSRKLAERKEFSYMDYSLGIKPFNDYWINCEFNMFFSVLTSFEPSYKFAAFLNDYSYDICELETPTNTKFNYITLKPMVNFREKYLDKLFYLSQPINFKHQKGYTEYLKEHIRNREFVMVGVDLFYWIPDSICWNRNHWEHYSLINGYSEEKKVFYVLDENNCGYNEFEIPEERFLVAVQNSPLEPHGYIKKVINEVGSFKLNIDDVICNAQRLRDELGAFEYAPLWQLSDADFDGGHMCDLLSMYIYQIINRHRANSFLFQEIKSYFQNGQIIDSIIQCSQALQEGWILIKNILVRTYFMDERKSNINDINERYKEVIDMERKMWDTFLTLAC
jgi:hypothetical protein